MHWYWQTQSIAFIGKRDKTLIATTYFSFDEVRIKSEEDHYCGGKLDKIFLDLSNLPFASWSLADLAKICF